MDSIKTKNISVPSENQKNYELSISLKKNSIELLVQDPNDISGIIYKNEYSHEKLCENKIFKMNDNINADFTNFFNRIKSKNIEIYLENENLCLIFKYQIFEGLENVKFILSSQKVKAEDIGYILSQKNKEIMELKKRINELEKENKFLKKYNEIDEIQKKFIDIQKENELFKRKIEVLFDSSFDFDIDEFKLLYNEFKKYSIIIGCGKDFELILRGIKKTVNKKINKITLLMTTRTDGDSSSTFHQKCDNKN